MNILKFQNSILKSATQWQNEEANEAFIVAMAKWMQENARPLAKLAVAYSKVFVAVAGAVALVMTSVQGFMGEAEHIVKDLPKPPNPPTVGE